MTPLRTKVYLGGFILAPILATFLMLTVGSFDLWLFLLLLFVFAIGVVVGPAFLEETEA